MANQQPQDTPKIGFKSIQLLKDQTLGIGSYGIVCKALCDDLLCVAKIIHPTLFYPNAHQRFLQECEFMSAIRHPSIVQFLGTHQDPQTGQPVLLMELMDESLTHFLESSQDAVPYHIQVNICHDLTLAISYLHSNEIIHRDLSSNNVLLQSGTKAKLSCVDLTIAKISKTNLRSVSFTMYPGSKAYMPPETEKDQPVYTAKIDSFGIGVLIIQILTRIFPDPGERQKLVCTNDLQFPSAIVQVPEIERRQNHISRVDPGHPLLPIALDCLKDSDGERPSAQVLCRRVAALKETTRFKESVRRAQKRPEPAGNTTEREEEIRELRQQVQDKDYTIEQKGQVIAEKDRALQQVTQQLESIQLDSKIRFKSIRLLKDHTLGKGSYGSVYKAVCDDLLCAAKIIHPTLFDPQERGDPNREHRLPIQRFRQECEFMSAIKHPNIVQFLGTHQDPQTGLPVLLMELMDDSLRYYLKSLKDTLPYHIQVNFCHDITLAISYLHSNKITHRDLSSNNVLLRGNVQAKVTDFGMANLSDKNPRATGVSFTLCPGTEVYMPPEAVKENPVYTEKIDCFSIGALIIQILTRCYPNPGERTKSVRTTDPRFPTVQIPVPELERRQNHISLVDPKHPLLPIALDCLKDSDVERPSTQELSHRISTLKETRKFRDSVQGGQERPAPTERDEENRELRQDDTHHTRQEHSRQIRGLQQIIGSQNDRLRQKDQLITEKDRHIRRVTEELESNQQVMAQFQTRIQELEELLKKKW